MLKQIMSFISTALPRITATWPQQSPGEKIERQVGLFGPKGFLKDKPKNKSVGLIFWAKKNANANPNTSQLQVVIYNNQR